MVENEANRLTPNDISEYALSFTMGVNEAELLGEHHIYVSGLRRR